MESERGKGDGEGMRETVAVLVWTDAQAESWSCAGAAAADSLTTHSLTLAVSQSAFCCLLSLDAKPTNTQSFTLTELSPNEPTTAEVKG